VSSLTELAGQAPLLANCAGFGAQELVPDPSVRPVRGQQVIVDNPDLNNLTRRRAPGELGVVLFVLTGSSCSGKTTLANALRADRIAVHDSDERGVPSGADLAWRQSELEQWVGIALDYEADGMDLLLTGQSPLGEVPAAPSAPRLSRVAACLVDVEDRTRLMRLERRDPSKWDRERKRQFIGWAALASQPPR